MPALEPMQFADSSTPIPLHCTDGRMRRMALLGVLSLVSIMACVGCSEQSVGSPASSALPTQKTSAPTSAVVLSGPRWQDLTKAQRDILRPLAGTWESLASTHKSKWIAVAQNYPSRAPPEQKKMQDRMVEWAALTPTERERARLNFAETKKIRPSDRAADWEAYQGLSAQEKQRLAARGTVKPAGAAIAVTPEASNKLTQVPVTRHTPAQDGDAAANKPRINPNTLLPQVVLPPSNTPTAIGESTSGAVVGGSSPAVSSETLSPN